MSGTWPTRVTFFISNHVRKFSEFQQKFDQISNLTPYFKTVFENHKINVLVCFSRAYKSRNYLFDCHIFLFYHFLILLPNLKFDRGFAEITENFLERVEIKKRLISTNAQKFYNLIETRLMIF